MKTLKDLKMAKTVKAVKKNRFDLDVYLKNMITRLQPEEYCNEFYRHNDFEVIDNGIDWILKADKVYHYDLCSELELADDVKADRVTAERMDKINRTLFTLHNCEITIPKPQVSNKEEACQITFRPCGDYVLTFEDGTKSYGEALKAKDLVKNNNGDIIGFNKFMYNGMPLEYRFDL